MIKVEHTKIQTIYFPISNHPKDRDGGIWNDKLVTDAELVLVNYSNGFYKDSPNNNSVLNPKSEDLKGLIALNGNTYRPILISRTEKIEDWYWNEKTNTIHQYTTRYFAEVGHREYDCFKILALPEHFSPQQLQMIVDGKLKEGKCLLWCIEHKEKPDGIPYNVVALGPHITIYPVEEKMYTREEVAKLLGKFCIDVEISKTPFSNTWINKWVEQNVK